MNPSRRRARSSSSCLPRARGDEPQARLLTTEALVSEIPEEKKDMAGAGGGMPGGGGMGGMY